MYRPCSPTTGPSRSRIRITLSVLENVLSRYPELYFDKLRGNYYREIVFYLAGDLIPLDETANISNAGAFATDCDGLCQIALGLWSDPDAATVIHELTHAADYRFSERAFGTTRRGMPSIRPDFPIIILISTNTGRVMNLPEAGILLPNPGFRLMMCTLLMPTVRPSAWKTGQGSWRT